MANNVLVKNLIDYGLSEKEAYVYLAVLQLETATVQEISKVSGVNRSSVYVVLNSLKKQGLVGQSGGGKIQEFVASSPELLLQFAKSRSQRELEIEEKISEIVPDLKALHKETRRRPKVRVFEGDKGAEEVYWSLLSEKKIDVLRTFANPVNIFKHVTNFSELDRMRGARGIKMYGINAATQEMVDLYKKVRPHEPYEITLIPEDKYKFTSDIGIYADKVSFVSPTEKLAIIIENKDISDMLKNIFDLAWEEAKRYNLLKQ